MTPAAAQRCADGADEQRIRGLGDGGRGGTHHARQLQRPLLTEERDSGPEGFEHLHLGRPAQRLVAGIHEPQNAPGPAHHVLRDSGTLGELGDVDANRVRPKDNPCEQLRHRAGRVRVAQLLHRNSPSDEELGERPLRFAVGRGGIDEPADVVVIAHADIMTHGSGIRRGTRAHPPLTTAVSGPNRVARTFGHA